MYFRFLILHFRVAISALLPLIVDKIAKKRFKSKLSLLNFHTKFLIANCKQANQRVIQASLSDIQANQTDIQVNWSAVFHYDWPK